MADLQAIVVAHNASFHCQRGGVVNIKQRPVMFAGSNAHTSLQKAAMISGLGSDAVTPVPVDGNFRMRADELDKLIRTSRTTGMRCTPGPGNATRRDGRAARGTGRISAWSHLIPSATPWSTWLPTLDILSRTLHD